MLQVNESIGEIPGNAGAGVTVNTFVPSTAGILQVLEEVVKRRHPGRRLK